MHGARFRKYHGYRRLELEVCYQVGNPGGDQGYTLATRPRTSLHHVRCDPSGRPGSQIWAYIHLVDPTAKSPSAAWILGVHPSRSLHPTSRYTRQVDLSGIGLDAKSPSRTCGQSPGECYVDRTPAARGRQDVQTST